MILTREDAIEYGMSFPDVYLDTPFHDLNWQLIRVKDSKKAFMLIFEWNGHICLNVKMDPTKAVFLRQAFPSVIPAYHQNKEHWSTIILDGTVPDREIELMIAESYDLVTDSPAKRIYEAVKRIPAGKVATYAQIAALAGEPKMARAVGNALHKNPDPAGIPCFRVVNAAGELSGRFAFGGPRVQEERLKADGVEVRNGKVDLSRFQWEEGTQPIEIGD